jgi:hypothetical protein
VPPSHETLLHYFSCSGRTVDSTKKHTETHYAVLVLLHLVGYAAPVVNSGASVRETSMHYF